MSHGSHGRRPSDRRASSFGFAAGQAESSRPLWVALTDLCAWTTFVAVAACLGGRLAIGQLVLVVGASATALCWLLHQLTAERPAYSWTGSEKLWLAGILIAVAQIVPLPREWLLKVAPKLKEILPLWFDDPSSTLGTIGWSQLSLAPWETASGLATFVAYAILFLVLAQRLQTRADVARMLCGVSLVTFFVAAFALLEFLTSNGNFYWVFRHPHVRTGHFPQGCFTNRNHLSQFISLGVGPLLWWILRLARSDTSALGDSPREPLRRLTMIVLFPCLAAMYLASLLTLSRGGLLALGTATAVSLMLMCRVGLITARAVAGLTLVTLVSAVLFYFTGYESLAGRIERSVDGGAKTSGRLEIWQANIDVARDFPVLGTGVGTHADAHRLHLDIENQDGLEFVHAESGYLQVASETGFAGFLIALLFIATSALWCLAGLRHPDLDCRAASAAILASLAANLSHAVGDFFWYTPSCMMLLGMQLAGAFRLARLARETSPRPAVDWSLPRPLTLLATFGLLAITAWLIDQKLPGALAEPDRLCALVLEAEERIKDDDESSEVSLARQKTRLRAVLRATRINPRDARSHEFAAQAYLELFELRQSVAANSLPLSQLEDAVQASQFQSPEELDNWLQRAVGPPMKLLRLADKSFRRAIQTSPVCSNCYLNLAQLSFLNRDHAESPEQFTAQSLRLRPHDPYTLFVVGASKLRKGDQEEALSYWRGAFSRSPKLRGRIAELLVPQVEPDFFMTHFQPDWQTIETIARAYDKAERADQAHATWQLYISEGERRLKRAYSVESNDDQIEWIALTLNAAHLATRDVEGAIRFLEPVAKRLPNSFVIRRTLGSHLYSRDRLTEAVTHLEWCAERRPDDVVLQQAALRAGKERLRSTTLTELDSDVTRPTSSRR